MTEREASAMRHRVKARPALLLGLAMALLSPSIAHAAKPGQLDRSFGDEGTARSPVRAGSASGVAIDHRGRIVAAGGSFTLVRFEASGRLDRRFGTKGVATISLPRDEGYVTWYASSMAIDSQRRTVVVGGKCYYEDPDRYELDRCEVALARFRPNGDPDDSFGAGGLATSEFGTSSYGNSVAVDSQDRIVVAGNGGFVLARYKPNGHLDPSFGTGGKEVESFGADAYLSSVALDSQGRIAAAGVQYESGGDNLLVARFLPDGGLDPSFWFGRGWVTTERGFATAVAVDSKDRILAAGGSQDLSGNSAFALARYTSKGQPARWFGENGTVTTHFGDTSSAVAFSVGIDSHGRFILVGDRDDDRTGDTDFALARYRRNGSLDRSFSRNGKATATLGHGLANAYAATIDSRDRIVVAGGHTSFLLARFIGYRRR